MFFAFLSALLLPQLAAGSWLEITIFYAMILLSAVSLGVVESIMARCRFLKVPQLQAGALAIAVLAIVLIAIFGGEWNK